MDVSTTDPHLTVFLAEHKVARMATVDVSGAPYAAPLWYLHVEGGLYLMTHGLTVKNIQSNPRVALTIDAGEPTITYQGVVLLGTAEIVRDERLIARLQDALAHRYFGSTDHPRYQEVMAIPGQTFVRFTQTSAVSWDYRRASG